jgi:phosphatidylcholine synthase
MSSREKQTVMKAQAFAVHVLTASGAGLSLLAMLSAMRGHWGAMFAWLGVALLVDAIDGPLARAFRVPDVLPRWSGQLLDLVVDFTTYVFVPALAVTTAGLMPEAMAIPAGLVIVVTGALYFSDGNMKMSDHYFLGFPAVWNVIAFYLLLLRPQPWVCAGTVALFAVLTFVPIRFVHPFRVQRWRALTGSVLAIWSILAIMAIIANMAPAPWIVAALCGLAMYFMLIGLIPERGSSG